MQGGQLALILAFAGTLLVAMIGFIGSRSGFIMSRRTELDKIYMLRLGTVEADNRGLEDQIDVLRKQHLEDMSALDKAVKLEARVEELTALLKRERDARD